MARQAKDNLKCKFPYLQAAVQVVVVAPGEVELRGTVPTAKDVAEAAAAAEAAAPDPAPAGADDAEDPG